MPSEAGEGNEEHEKENLDRASALEPQDEVQGAEGGMARNIPPGQAGTRRRITQVQTRVEIPQAECVRVLTAEQARIQGRVALERGKEMGVLSPDTIQMLENVYGSPAVPLARTVDMQYALP